MRQKMNGKAEKSSEPESDQRNDIAAAPIQEDDAANDSEEQSELEKLPSVPHQARMESTPLCKTILSRFGDIFDDSLSDAVGGFVSPVSISAGLKTDPRSTIRSADRGNLRRSRERGESCRRSDIKVGGLEKCVESSYRKHTARRGEASQSSVPGPKLRMR